MEKINKFMEGRKTYLGLAILVLTLIFKRLDLDVGDAEIQALVEDVFSLIGTGLTIYGRANVKK